MPKKAKKQGPPPGSLLLLFLTVIRHIKCRQSPFLVTPSTFGYKVLKMIFPTTEWSVLTSISRLGTKPYKAFLPWKVLTTSFQCLFSSLTLSALILLETVLLRLRLRGLICQNGESVSFCLLREAFL